MQNWTTVISFTYPHEAHLAKGKLESEGINVILKDELTTQVNNFYSNAIGGVKLQIKESDIKRAKQILTEGGFLNSEPIEPNRFLVLFNEYTSKLPFIGKSILELRLMVIVAVTVTALFFLIEFVTRPSKIEVLTENSWCVSKLFSNGKELSIISDGLSVEFDYENCSETFNFRRNGVVIFPKINSKSNWFQWDIENDSLIITSSTLIEFPLLGDSVLNAKTTAENSSIYLGKYSVEIINNQVQLKSEDLIIQGVKYRNNFTF
jgi:hypothetical protein